jgi:hypothetical protein
MEIVVKRLVLAVLATIVAAGIYYTASENSKRRRAEEAERTRVHNEMAKTLSLLVQETNAVDDWDKMLGRGQSYRLEPVLSIELERLWMAGRPILFIGSIDDIKSHDASSYDVQFGQSLAASQNISPRFREGEPEAIST